MRTLPAFTVGLLLTATAANAHHSFAASFIDDEAR